MLKDKDSAATTEHKVPRPMMSKKILFCGFACIAVLGSLYAVLAMLTQAMLSGTSAESIWWDRIYIWWVDFLAAGLLMMLAIYLWRKSRRLDDPNAGLDRRVAWRIVLFPVGYVLLTACLYFADFASYLKDQDGAGERTATYFAAATGLVMAAITVFWQANKLKIPRSRMPSLSQ